MINNYIFLLIGVIFIGLGSIAFFFGEDSPDRIIVISLVYISGSGIIIYFIKKIKEQKNGRNV